MKIVDVPIEAIQPYDKNPRHNSEAIEKVANSIEAFGFVQPIVVDKDSVIIIGHTRCLAAKTLGMVTVPVVVASDLDEAKVKALRLVDNKTGEISIWNNDLLNLELEELQNYDLEYDLEEFGFEKLIDDVFNGTEFEDDVNDNAFEDSDDDDTPKLREKLTSLKIEFDSAEDKIEAYNRLGITIELDYISWDRLKTFLKKTK